MEIYLVGGAVRDKLLGVPTTERDWVVVGATIEEMLAQGYKPVGKDFPVFLHPKTHEEYALARTERKISKGYKGFKVYTDPNVTLEEDLKRRDLTINAMAESVTGELIDPFHGQQDLQQKLLRHVSTAFAEDPVRILRTARFAARFAGFTVASTTMELMQQMVKSGEVSALVPERVWQELVQALTEPQPWQFFAVLHDCHALKTLFPALATNYQVLQQLLQAITKLTLEPSLRFAALTSALRQEQIIELCHTYKVPTAYLELALLVATHKTKYEAAVTVSATELITTLEALDAFRRPQRFHDFLLVCSAILANSTKCHDHLLSAYSQASDIDTAALSHGKKSGQEIRQAIFEARVARIGET